MSSRPVVLHFLGDTKSLDAAWKKVQGDAAKTDAKLASFGKFSRGMQQVGKGLSRWITLPVVAGGVAALKMAYDFTGSLAKINQLVGASAPMMAYYQKQILALSPAVAKGPNELAKALYFITSSGFSGAAAIKILTASAKASTAGLGETQTVADAVTSAVSAYGEKALSAAKATDVLVATVREGKAEPEQLAKTIGKVISPASELHVKFQEVGAAIAAMTRVGLDSFTATTSLRQIFVTLAKPAKQTEDALKKVGLSAAGLRKEIKDKGLLAALKTMADHAKNNPAVLAKMFPNVRALTGFLGMMGPQVKQTTALFATMAKTGGDTDVAFKKASQTVQFKFHKALAALQSVGIKIGVKLLPYLTKAADFVSKLADKFDKLSPSTQRLIGQIVLFAAATGPVLYMLGKVGSVMTSIARHPLITALTLLAEAAIYAYLHFKSFRDGVNEVGHALAQVASFVYRHRTAIIALTSAIVTFKATLMAVKAITTAYTAAMDLWAARTAIAKGAVLSMRAAMWLLNVAMDANPIGLIIAALAALAVGFYYAWTHSQTFRQIITTVFSDIVKVAAFEIDKILGLLGGLLHGAAIIAEKLHLPFAKGLESAYKAFDSFHHKTIDAMNGFANKVYDSQHKAAKNVGNAMLAESARNKAIAKRMADIPLAALKDSDTRAAAIAKATGEGIADGIAAGMAKRKAWLLALSGKLGEAAAREARRGAQVASPSRITTYVGLMIAAGLAKGITDGRAGVIHSVDAQTAALVAALKKAQQKASDAAKTLALTMTGHMTGKGKNRHYVAPSPVSVHNAQVALRNARQAVAEIKAKIAAAIREQAALNKRRAAGKPLLGIADMLTAGLEQEVAAAKGPVTTLADRLVSAITKQFADKKGKLPPAVAATIANLKTLAAQAQQFHTDLMSKLTESKDFISHFQGTGAGAGDIKAFLTDQVAKIKTLGADLTGLAKRGLPQSLLKQLALGGLDSLPMAESLMHASDADFSSILALQKQIDTVSNATANSLEGALYGGKLSPLLNSGGTGMKGSTENIITVNANTNASAADIAAEIAWELKKLGA